MAEHTLSFSESAKGFPSFYSFIPEYMIGMNNYFYSFSKGQLYRHNTNESRNEYYGEVTSSSIKTVINSDPFDNKLFKTLNLESTDGWTADILTDVAAQSSNIDSTSFEKKEGSWFSYIRTNGVDASGPALTESDYKSRTVGGVGDLATKGSLGGTLVSLFFLVPISDELSVGDYCYFVISGQSTSTFLGVITESGYNESLSKYYVNVDYNAGSGVEPTAGDFILYAKNSQAESLGLLGHYAEITLTLPSTVTTESELFAIESELMRSNP